MPIAADSGHDAGPDSTFDGADDAGVDGEDAGTTPVPTSEEQLMAQFPAVTDWSAIEIVHADLYTPLDGTAWFKLPIRARCKTTGPRRMACVSRRCSEHEHRPG